MKTLRFLFVGLLVIFFIGSANNLKAQDKPVEKVAKFEVSMHCNSCKSKIERDLAFEKGVKEVKADLEQKTVTVKYTEGIITEDKLVAAIKKLGYEVKVVNEAKKEVTPKS